MQQKKIQPFFFITIFVTILIVAIQIYWNIEIYSFNKSQYTEKVQTSFDQAVDLYYFEIGKSDVLSIIDTSPKTDSLKGFDFIEKIAAVPFDDFFKKNDSAKFIDFRKIEASKTEKNIKVLTGRSAMDDQIYGDLKINNITITQVRDSINFNLLRTISDSIFLQKKINNPYNIIQSKKDTVYKNLDERLQPNQIITYTCTSKYIPKTEKLKFEYTNATKQAFLSSLLGMVLSLILITGILSSIYFLINTINRQKQLAEIKEDFIGNITHEFKTPISIVSAAIEALDNFNLMESKEKTKKYLSISKHQIEKLDTMVEKLLDSALLDRKNFTLTKKPVNIIPIVKKNLTKYQLISPHKNINLNCHLPEIILNIDAFYFSSAISNLLDNAVKYGGKDIEVKIDAYKNTTLINITDNGSQLNKVNSAHIFDKFTRVNTIKNDKSKGNGIGLYFCKKVIEKHGGTIQLKTTATHTTFTICL